MRCFAPLAWVLTLTLVVGCARESSQPREAPKTNMSPTAPVVPSNGVAMSKADLLGKADVPLYPGADVPEGQSKVTPSSSVTRYEVHMVTSDSLSKVAEYYRGKLHLDKQGTANKADMYGLTTKGKLITIKLEMKTGKTYIQAVTIDEKKL